MTSNDAYPQVDDSRRDSAPGEVVTGEPRAPRAARPARRGTMLVLLAVLVSAAACGGDDPAASAPSAEGATAASASDADGDATGAAGDSGDCAPTEVSFTNDAAGISGTATAALATDTTDGSIYAAHIADFDITPEDLQSWRPEVPADGNVFTILFTTFDGDTEVGPPVEGDVLPWNEPAGLTYVVRHFSADDEWSSVQVTGDAIEQTGGDLTVTASGDHFCFEIDYQDPDKSVSGTVAAGTF